MGNKKNLILGGIAVGVFALITIILYATQTRKVEVDPAFKAYISAFTSGTISREATIRIQLQNEAATKEQINKPVDKELFDFSPSVEGKAFWIDTRTIEFRPAHAMQPGETYKATFYLSEVMKVPSKFSEFVFNFDVIKQSFEVVVDGLRPQSSQSFNRQMLLGHINTADVDVAANIEKVLTATQGNKTLPIRWTHASDRLTHSFNVDSIIRGEDSSVVVLKWDGSPIDVDMKGEQKVTVPALGDFIVTEASVFNRGEEQYLLIQFSDPLQPGQNLDGLITLESLANLRFTIEENTVRVYSSYQMSGTRVLHVYTGIKNALGKNLKQEYMTDILFEEIKPAVRLVGKGVIIPASEGLLFPFEAVNLSAVDVRIVKIYEDNVLQFLQVNDIGGQYEMSRVGKIVLDKKVALSSIKQSDLTRWSKYSLDLGTLIKPEMGAIYRVTLDFKREYSLYPCAGSDTVEPAAKNMQSEWDEEIEESDESSNWDYYEDYYEDGESYDWSQRDNPCSKSYYMYSNRVVSRNVLASNLGLLAKKGSEGSITFVVTDLLTAQPLSGTNLEIYDYQRQVLAKAITNTEGIAEVKLKESPFFLVAKRGTQRGYLKLMDGYSLSMSMFDVSGETVQKGIKGFIYGERGVWRPGDSLFLTFIMEDKQKTLPPSYPVTFELYNPRGQVARKIIRGESLNGFYNFTTTTSPEAPTGNWEARVKVGNATFSKTIKIETVMPNRLKIKFDFPKPYLAKNENQSATLDVSWLTGVTAHNLKSTVEVSLASVPTYFAKYKEYTFDDPTRTFYSERQTIFEDEIDDNGKAKVDADIEVTEAAPGMLQANFVTKVFEPGGNFSVDRFSMPYHPYDVYTGLRIPKGDKARGMLLTDTNHIVQIVSVDKDGNPVAAKRQVVIEFYKIEWRWWWNQNQDYLANYTYSSHTRFLAKDTVTVTNGAGQWNMRQNYPEWGRYLIRITDVESGHSTGKVFYMDWPGWAGRARKDQSTNATMLSFAADKEKYNVGEQVTLTIPSSKNSRALISIESGTKVIQTFWVDGSEGETQFKFGVTPEMTPNVYAHVTLIQPHSQTLNDLPIRMYGVIPILVEDKNTHLKPVIKMESVLRPEAKVSIAVSEADGKAMTYTVAVVDEGLLDLTRFKTPDPWSSFYAREALGVKTWDLFDEVMGAWGAELERILSIGGDEVNKPKEGNKANRFKPVVKFMGPFYLEKGKTATHSFIMPQYVGSVRTMVIAGQDGAYGSAEKSTPVRKPLMVLGTLPRVLGPDETVDLPVTVFAMEKNVKEVTVTIAPNDMFTVEGRTSQLINFTKPGDEVVTFKLKVKSKLGLAKVKITAISGKEKAETNIELDVRVPNPRVVEVMDTILALGQSWNATYKPFGIGGTNKVTVEFSSIPPINLGKRLNYLIHYPYGCVEQTTSSVFPQLFLSDLMEMTPEQKSRAEMNIKAGIDRLRLFQLPSGAMAYWPGENTASDWGTNYAGHFMIEAELKGYALPSGFIESWKKYQRSMASSWTMYSNNSVLDQAYRLYTLALAKSPDLSSMNRLKEVKNMPVTAIWTLAAAYQLAGQAEVANQLTAKLPVSVNNYTELSGTFGSDERDESIILEALSLMGKKEQALPLMRELCKGLSSYEWMSTQTISYALLAIGKYVGKAGIKGDMNFTYKVNGGTEQSVLSKSVLKQVEIKVKGAEPGTVSAKNNSSGILYVRIISEGIPKTGDPMSSNSNLNMQVVYKDLDGNQVDPANMKQGKDFYAEVSITNPGQRGDYSEMALTQIFPSGWEILNTRLDQMEDGQKTSTPRYQDIRDDRVYTFFNLQTRETKTFRIYLNSSYLGNFYMPTIYAEAMYDASINAKIGGKWVKVVSEAPKPKELSSAK